MPDVNHRGDVVTRQRITANSSKVFSRRFEGGAVIAPDDNSGNGFATSPHHNPSWNLKTCLDGLRLAA